MKYTPEENIAFIQYIRNSEEAIKYPNTDIAAWKHCFVLGLRYGAK